MQTITDKLQILKDNAEDIRQALSDKVGYDVGPMLKDYSKIIADIKIGVSEEPDVNFYDYDGTLLHAYTKDEFLALTALPELPSQPGLVCQGWNWALEDAKVYAQEHDKLNIGATYITNDGKTRLYINLLNNGMTIPLYIDQSDDNGVTVDWGDGTNTETISGTGRVTFNHIYNEAGSYTISLKVDSGACALGHNSDSYNVIGAANTIASGYLYKTEIGSNMSIVEGAFYTCYSLQSITLPNSLESIEYEAFRNCSSLTSITIPNSVTSIGDYAFQYCYGLNSITIPNSVTSIGEGAFYNCYSMQYYDFTSHTSIPTLYDAYVFDGINDGCEIRVPAALYWDWINATNWSSYVDYIVAYNENGEKVTS